MCRSPKPAPLVRHNRARMSLLQEHALRQRCGCNVCVVCVVPPRSHRSSLMCRSTSSTCMMSIGFLHGSQCSRMQPMLLGSRLLLPWILHSPSLRSSWYYSSRSSLKQSPIRVSVDGKYTMGNGYCTVLSLGVCLMLCMFFLMMCTQCSTAVSTELQQWFGGMKSVQLVEAVVVAAPTLYGHSDSDEEEDVDAMDALTAGVCDVCFMFVCYMFCVLCILCLFLCVSCVA